MGEFWQKNIDAELGSLHGYDDLLQIYQQQQITRSVDTVIDYVLRNNLADGPLYGFIDAIQVVYKAIAWKIGRYNMAGVGKATFIDKKRLYPCETSAKRFEKHLEDLFINVVGNTGVVGYMISKHTNEIIKVECQIPGRYMLTFNIIDSRDNLNDNLPVGSIFALYKLNQEREFELEDHPGNSIVTAGFALYGTCTMLFLAFSDYQGVHGFHLDQSLGEFTLCEPNKQVPKRGTSYSVNEGITSGWDEATKIFINGRKNPRCSQIGESYYIGSLSADVIRLLSGGGIFMYPSNVKYPNGKLHLLCECNPMAYILRQAGGYATDGFVNILDVEPHTAHQQTPFFGGSIEDVIRLMELKTIHRLKSARYLVYMEELCYKRILCPGGTILPEETLRSSSATYITLTSYVSNALHDLRVSRLILAITVAIKAISASVRKKAVAGEQVLGYELNPDKPTDAEISNEIFFQLIKDTGVVWQVGCATHAKPDTFLEYEDADYVVNFSAQDGPPNLPGTACYSGTFAIYKRYPELFVEDHTLQPGKNILYSGYSVYGTSTVFYLSLSKGKVDAFLLDPLVGELVLVKENIKIPIKSPLYTINEAISFYYSQKILDWLDAKKNPKDAVGAKGRYIVSKIADMHRVLKNGGIYCHPYSKIMDFMHPHHLVYECLPMAHLITQAGGLATNGKSWLLDVVPKQLHCTTALFIGSAFEVELLLQYVNPKLLLNMEEKIEKSEESVIKNQEEIDKSEVKLIKSEMGTLKSESKLVESEESTLKNKNN